MNTFPKSLHINNHVILSDFILISPPLQYFSEAAYNPESNQRQLEMPAPVAEHESRLFDAYRRPRAALPAPQTPARLREDPEYATVASLAPTRFDARLAAPTHYLLHDR